MCEIANIHDALKNLTEILGALNFSRGNGPRDINVTLIRFRLFIMSIDFL